jgi:acyl-coenzyme A thioesterase PaaI-like protein
MMAIAQKHPHRGFRPVMQRALGVAAIDLRAATGSSFRASSEITRLGGRVGSAQMRLHDDEDRPVATACGSYVVS